MQHLIIFSIGPVQDFINTARRSRDLWYGSWMLSELSKVAAKEIVERKGELIFPASTDIESIPNKIVAVVETDDPKKFANGIKTATVDYLVETLANPTLNNIEKKIAEKKSHPINRTLADEQIKDLPEVYWVSVPYNNKEEYEIVREQAEAILIARKNTRGFNQMTGANIPKSSLDGSRESVIDENEYPKNNASNKEDMVRDLYEKYRARQGERLSGVDLLKRLGARKDEPDFKSTSHMAAIPFMDKLGPEKTEKLIKDIQSVFASKKWSIDEKDEGALLYESRLADWIPVGTKPEVQKKIREEYNKIWEENELKDSRPSPYYALLRADGDNMGKVIDGQTEEGKHRELSEALSEFATKVKTIVEIKHKNKKYNKEIDNKGLLIYSGGDDVLAYLPINTVLKCAEELEEEFRNSLNGFQTKEDRTPTLSIGIVIAHHLDPLSDVLQLARNAEHTAKTVKDEDGDKNGLAVTLSKRSGIDRTIVGRFTKLYSRLEQMIDLTNEKIISGGTAYELQELGRVLPDDFPLNGLKDEAIRIVKRKQSSDGKKLLEEDKQKYINKYTSTVDGWLKNISSVKQKPKHYSLHDLANEMIIAKALADGAESSTDQNKEAKHES